MAVDLVHPAPDCTLTLPGPQALPEHTLFIVLRGWKEREHKKHQSEFGHGFPWRAVALGGKCRVGGSLSHRRTSAIGWHMHDPSQRSQVPHFAGFLKLSDKST